MSDKTVRLCGKLSLVTNLYMNLNLTFWRCDKRDGPYRNLRYQLMMMNETIRKT